MDASLLAVGDASLSSIDIVVLVLYVAGVVGLGVWFARKGQTSDRFMAAGRSLPGWVVGMSIIGTFVSAISFIANPGKSFGGDWNPFVFGLSLPLAAWIATKYFVPYYRSSGEVSAYSHLEKRFGPWARSYAAVIYLMLQVVRMGSIMYLMSLPLHYLLRWPVWAIIVGMGVLVTVYTLLGGIEAVIWTDVVQTFVLVGGALVAAMVLLWSMPEGPGQIFELAREGGKFSLGSFGPSPFEWAFWTKSTFWVVLVFGLFENLKNFGIDQSYIQRYATAKSEREAKKSVWFGALAYLTISAVLFFVGTALFAYYAAQPELLDPQLTAAGKADHVFPFFIVTKLPTGLCGLLIAGIFAAGMSTVDSGLNCSATLTLSDFYRRHFRKDAGEKESMRVLQISTVVWGVLAVGIALAMIGVKSALDVWWKISSAFGGGILGLFLLGFLSKKAKNTAAIAGVCTGVMLILWMSLTPMLADQWGILAGVRSPFHGFLSIVFGTVAIVLVGFLVTLVIQKVKGSGGEGNGQAA
jgi:SSS family solute:Na+ symporter